MTLGDLVNYIPSSTLIRIYNSNGYIVLTPIRLELIHPRINPSWYNLSVEYIEPHMIPEYIGDGYDYNVISSEYDPILDIHLLTSEVTDND